MYFRCLSEGCPFTLCTPPSVKWVPTQSLLNCCPLALHKRALRIPFSHPPPHELVGVGRFQQFSLTPPKGRAHICSPVRKGETAMSRRPCPDCDEPGIMSDRSNGKCLTCHGAGQKSRSLDAIIPPDPEIELEQCPTCGGSGVCTTCNGSGYSDA